MLNKDDIKILEENGLDCTDVNDVEKVIKTIKYTDKKNRRIKRNVLLNNMSREEWLSGVARAYKYAFAMRFTEDGDVVFFDATAVAIPV